MLEDETDSEIARSKNLAQRLGLTWDKYLQLAAKTEPQSREESRPVAEKRLKRLLTLMPHLNELRVFDNSAELANFAVP